MGDHAPLTPSRLWQSHEPGSSPEDERPVDPYQDDHGGSRDPNRSPPHWRIDPEHDEIHPLLSQRADPVEDAIDTRVEGDIDGSPGQNGDAWTRLRESYNRGLEHGVKNDNHGTFTPGPTMKRGTMSFDSQYSFGAARSSIAGKPNDDNTVGGGTASDSLLRSENGGKNMSTTQWLAHRHGIQNQKRMYLAYYIPFFNWITQYQWSFLKGDLIAALTMASFYIPMALSFAENLGHIPAINGLYSFVFNPLVYAFLGTCPQMVVGPEAAGSLLVGSVVRSSVDKGHSGDEDNVMNARIAGVVTGMAGAVIFIAGIARLGFLDGVLSRPFLRGFISAIGFVIFVDQLIPEMGLSQLAKETGILHASSVEKLVFLVKHTASAHGLTCGVAFGSFVIIMICRTLKNKLQPRYPSVAYIPDRFLIVVLSAVLTYAFDWESHGLKILGTVESSTGSAFPFRWPFLPSHIKHVREAMSTSFLIALLGFFESSVAAKAVGALESHREEEDRIRGMSLSANRELVALGVANLVGGCFMSLPAFGGYGRSKVNASTGGRTPMSSIFLSLITVFCILFLLPYFYYLPKAVLSSMVSVVAYSLIEECPHDIMFFIQIRGFVELGLMFLIFGATIFYSLALGVSLGMGFSILLVIMHSTKPRIQILGKVPGTADRFENAEGNTDGLEFIEGCLIIKIPEPLTFANTGDLKNRLRRLELYGTTAAHPALPRMRSPEHNENIIFDVHGVTGLDGSGTQVLREIVDSYVDRGVQVFFCRVQKSKSNVFRLFERSGIVEKCGGLSHFVGGVEEALKMADISLEYRQWQIPGRAESSQA